jgi:hypothetical protein
MSSPPATGRAALFVVATVFALLNLATRASAQETLVEITGGRDLTGHWYKWVVKNRADSPIIYVEFPHYRADMWNIPDHWERETINLQGLPGVTEEAGVFKAWADPPRGIQAGGSAEFEMRINRKEAYRGTGTVVVRFADGGEAKVAGVDLPCPPSFLENHGMPIVMAALLLILVGYKAIKHRYARAERQPGSERAQENDK